MHVESRRAWMQGAILLAAVAAIGLALVVRLQRPFDRDTLAIQIAQLQSSAAEAQVLADNVRADNLAPGVVRQHAQQMADKVQDTNGKLQKGAEADIAAQKAGAQRLGASLHDALLRLGRDGSGPMRRSYGFDAMAHALAALHKQLKADD